MNLKKEINIGNKKIGEEHPTFIIAEAGVNHNGDVQIAHELIDAAAEPCADYGVVPSDQRIYAGSSINTPAVYSASKAGMIGLTKYLAAYWAASNIRVNVITANGVFNNQEESFVHNYEARTPYPYELRGAVTFLA